MRCVVRAHHVHNASIQRAPERIDMVLFADWRIHLCPAFELLICLWGHKGGQPRSMRLPDLTAGDLSKDAEYLGLGTRNGAVALARIASLEKRIKPDLVRAFESPVTSIAFSQRGRWLATGAEGLRIWTWED